MIPEQPDLNAQTDDERVRIAEHWPSVRRFLLRSQNYELERIVSRPVEDWTTGSYQKHGRSCLVGVALGCGDWSPAAITHLILERAMPNADVAPEELSYDILARHFGMAQVVRAVKETAQLILDERNG